MSESSSPRPRESRAADAPAVWEVARRGALAVGRVLTAVPLRSVAVGLCAFAATGVYLWRADLSYPVRHWLFWSVALLWVYNLVLFTAIVSVGHLVVTRVLRLRMSPLETLAQCIPVGLTGFCLAMYALGACGLFRTSTAIGLAVVSIGLNALPLRRFFRESLSSWRAEMELDPPGLFGLLALAFGVVCLGLVYFPLLTPAAVNFDASWYHLTIAQDYAREGRIIPFMADYARNWPQLAPIIHTWGWLLPVPGTLERWTLPLHTEFCVFLGTLVGVSAVVRRVVAPTLVRFSWVGFFLFPSIFIYDQNIGGGDDHFVALFGPPLLLCAMRAAERLDARQLALFGVLTGGAILTRYQGAYLVLASGSLLVIAWCWYGAGWVRQRVGRESTADEANLRMLLWGPLLAVGIAVVVMSPHFLRNWIFYGNPFYPWLQAELGGTPAHAASIHEVEVILKGDHAFRSTGSLGHRFVEALKLLFTFSFVPHYNFAKPWPLFGSLFTLTLPLLLFMPKPGRLLKASWVAVAAILTWGMLLRVDRHLQAVLPILVAATTALLVRAWSLGWVARAGTACLVALQIIWGGDAVFHEPQHRLEAALKLVTSGYRDALRERESYRAKFIAVNAALPPDAQVLLRPMPESLGIDRRTYLDQAGHQGLITYAGIGGPTALKQYYDRLGITHLVVFPRTDSWDKRAEILTQDFYRSARVQNVGGLNIVTVAGAQPRPDPVEYLVVMAGVAPYRNGLYLLDELGTWEPWDYPGRQFAPPRQPLPADEAESARLLEGVSAVMKGLRVELRPLEERTLQRRFQLVRSGRAFQLFLVR